MDGESTVVLPEKYNLSDADRMIGGSNVQETPAGQERFHAPAGYLDSHGVPGVQQRGD
jgi:hypothetical protein